MICAWYKSYLYELRIETTSKSDLHSYGASKAVAKRPRRNFWGFNWIFFNILTAGEEKLNIAGVVKYVGKIGRNSSSGVYVGLKLDQPRK